MPRRKKSRKKLKKGLSSHFHRISLEPEAIQGVTVVGLFTLGILFILSLMGKAGALGQFLNIALLLSFGWGRFIIPIIILYLAIREAWKSKEQSFRTNYLGLLLFWGALLGLFHLFISPEKSIPAISKGLGGGYIGYVASYPFLNILGFWGALVVLAAFLAIGIMIAFNTSIERLILIFTKLKKARKETHIEEVSKVREEKIPSKQKISARRILEKLPSLKKTKEKEERSRETQPALSELKYAPFPLKLLDSNRSSPKSGNIRRNNEIIQKTLADFGINVEMGGVNVGPTVTQYTLRPDPGVRLSEILSLANNLALALAAHPIRIEAPIPGKPLVGIEIPNTQKALVHLREILETPEFHHSKSNLSLALGRDVSGNPVISDLKTMPHLLIAGATGSGKTICLNGVILSLIYQNPPEKLRFIIVDPKRVDLALYNSIPHLLTPVVTDIPKIVNALRWSIAEMDRRFKLLSEAGRQNVETYNANHGPKLPYIAIVIDELADLMSVAFRDVEAAIVRLSQMARAVGLHLIVATQRPSVDVITGLIKANITSRIAFQTASSIDSRTILDTSGAEKLLGSGDMLYLPQDMSKPKRIQGVYISEDEVKRITDYLKNHGSVEYEREVLKEQKREGGFFGELVDDELFDQAKEVVVQAGKASASLLQRRLRIGYARAARLLDLLEEKGVIGPADGAKPRKILIENIEDADKIDEREENE